MPALQVRDFPDELYEELKTYAARNHRSIAQQTISCVESEIARSKARQSGAPVLESNLVDFIPANIREASVPARFVNPFEWLSTIESASKEEIAQRRAKLEDIGRKSDERRERAGLPRASCEEIAQMIRSDREKRSDRILAIAERHIAPSEEA